MKRFKAGDIVELRDAYAKVYKYVVALPYPFNDEKPWETRFLNGTTGIIVKRNEDWATMWVVLVKEKLYSIAEDDLRKYNV